MSRLSLPPGTSMVGHPSREIQSFQPTAAKLSLLSLCLNLTTTAVAKWFAGGTTLALTTVALFYWGSFYYGGLFSEFSTAATAMEPPMWLLLTGGATAAARVVFALIAITTLLGFVEFFRNGSDPVKVGRARRHYYSFRGFILARRRSRTAVAEKKVPEFPLPAAYVARASEAFRTIMVTMLAFVVLLLCAGTAAKMSYADGAEQGRKIGGDCAAGRLGYVTMKQGRTANFCHRMGAEVVLFDTREQRFFVKRWSDVDELTLPRLPSR